MLLSILPSVLFEAVGIIIKKRIKNEIIIPFLKFTSSVFHILQENPQKAIVIYNQRKFFSFFLTVQFEAEQTYTYDK